MSEREQKRAIDALESYLNLGYVDDAASFDLVKLLVETDQSVRAREVLAPLLRRHPDSAELTNWAARAARGAR